MSNNPLQDDKTATKMDSHMKTANSILSVSEAINTSNFLP
jgi:hypothetical protein